MLLAADDTTAALTTVELVEKHYPEAVMTDRLKEWLSSDNPYRGLIDCSVARDVIGWTPCHSWREKHQEV